MSRKWSWVRRSAGLHRRDILWTLLPGILWAVLAFGVRPLVSHLECSKDPGLCSRSEIPWPDRLGVDFANSRADHWSYSTQNWAGVAAIGIPAVYGMVQITTASLTWPAAVAWTISDVVLLMQATFSNGVLNELVRIGVQRPRPSVYRNPTFEGARPENYTSFYSGHTSFTALAAGILLFSLLARGASLPWLLAGGTVGVGLVFFTGLFRILGGRHFITDVLAGAMAGFLIATWVAYRHRKRS